MTTTAKHAEEIREHGFTVVRGAIPRDEMAAVQQAADAVYAEGLKHHASYRDRNLLFEILNDPKAKRRVVLQAHWFSWINPVLEQARRHPNLFKALEPLLGRDIKQIANQIHWKPPGAKFTFYRFHQDLRFRDNKDAYRNLETSWLNTGLAIDPQNEENGALRVFRGSNKLGYLGLSDDGPIMKGETQEPELRRARLDPADMVTLDLQPGDLVIWTLLTVHGSAANVSGRDRRFMINSYIRAADSPDRGEWAFKDGVSTPLGAEPQICKYEKLREKPGPFYIEEDWTGEALKDLPEAAAR
jgi:ectoine hydroxylase-related dioxygenase (phytanoyl-CoA dioxygenase family)